MYKTFYKLSRKPFQLNPDPDFFFNSAVHKRALAYLRYGLSQGEGFIVVTGQPGTGKTMLAKELFKEIENANVIAGRMVTTQVEAEDMLRLIANAFGVEHSNQSKAELLNNLESYFALQASEGKRVLLVVDEAQNLPKDSLEELRMLSNLEADGRIIFQSFLLGQDEFRSTLQLPELEQVRQRVVSTYHLRPLEKEETKKYILHRLSKADWVNNPSFTDEAFVDIFLHTEGVPRIINTFCDRLLLYGFLEELKVIDRAAVQAVAKEFKQEVPEKRSASFTPAALKNLGSSSNFTVKAGSVEGDAGLEQRLRELESKVMLMQQNLHSLQLERSSWRKAALTLLEEPSVTSVE